VTKREATPKAAPKEAIPEHTLPVTVRWKKVTVEPAKIEFRHTAKAEGQWESICMGCYQKVGTPESEQRLFEMEKLHECDVSIGAMAHRLSKLLL
jgi:hypothetical protein